MNMQFCCTIIVPKKSEENRLKKNPYEAKGFIISDLLQLECENHILSNVKQMRKGFPKGETSLSLSLRNHTFHKRKLTRDNEIPIDCRSVCASSQCCSNWMLKRASSNFCICSIRGLKCSEDTKRHLHISIIFIPSIAVKPQLGIQVSLINWLHCKGIH